MILQFVTQGVSRPAAAVCLGYPTNFIAVMENCPVPVGIVDDVITLFFRWSDDKRSFIYKMKLIPLIHQCTH